MVQFSSRASLLSSWFACLRFVPDSGWALAQYTVDSLVRGVAVHHGLKEPVKLSCQQSGAFQSLPNTDSFH